jgi:hypothetical protein
LILALCPVIFQNSPLDYLCFRFCSWSFGWYLFISNNLWKSNFASILSSFDFLFSPWFFVNIFVIWNNLCKLKFVSISSLFGFLNLSYLVFISSEISFIV